MSAQEEEEEESSRKKQRLIQLDTERECSAPSETTSPSLVMPSTSTHAIRMAEFPSLVFSIVVETLDVKLLKTCRLVCKSWNDAACQALRARSCVKVSENTAKRSEDLKNLLVNRAFGPTTLSSPFQNLNISVTFFSDECFKTLVHMPNTVITTLYVLLIRNLDQRQLETFLVAKGRQINYLQMNVAEANDGFSLDPALMANDQIRLPGLKHLKFSDSCPRNCRHVDLIKKLIRHASLEEIDLLLRDASLLTHLFTPEDLENVKVLTLNFSVLSPEDSAVLACLRLPALKELTVQVRDVSDGTFPQFASLVQNVSPTIKSLSSNLARLELIPPCPKLQKIVLFRFDSKISELALAKFPALEFISIRRLVATWRFLENDFIPHPGVTKIAVNVLGTEFEQKEFAEESLHIFLANLSRQFPNTEKLSLGIFAFNSGTFRDINYAFPRLQTLGITSQCDFASMSGMKIDDVHYYLEAGWPVESIPRKNSIFDFTALEAIELSGFIVTNDMITYCLAKIPTLKSAGFSWNKNLSAQEVRDCLGHLERISIYNSSVKEFAPAMAQLESMRNVHLS